MSRALVPVTIMASEFCQDIQDATEYYHEQFMKKLLRAYKNYVFRYVSPDLTYTTQVFPVDSQIELPCDFVYETKIGLLRNGRLVTLDFNKDLRPNNQRFSDSEAQNQVNFLLDGTVDPGLWYQYVNPFRNGRFLGELYGMGSGFHANTWYNIKEGVLELSSIIPDDGETELVIEYKSTGIKDQFKLIPDELEEVTAYKAKELFYEISNPNLSAEFASKYKTEYQRVKRLYASRTTPDYAAWLFKSVDRSMHL